MLGLFCFDAVNLIRRQMKLYVCIACIMALISFCGCLGADYDVDSETIENTTTAEATFDTTTPIIPENSIFSIHFIDVGQGDAALVECDGHYMLIDGGNKGDSDLIYSVLKDANVPKLDIVVASHAHEDYVGGLPGALNYTSADLTLCPVTSFGTEAFADLKKYTDLNGGGITVPNVGDRYELGCAIVEILAVNSTTDENDYSIILMITYGSTRYLFTGDAERAAEQAVLASGADLKADVLKSGHHGSADATTYPFLREVMPEYAVISVGSGNPYGHPTESVLSKLRDAEVTVYRTDLDGDIYCTSDGQSVSFTVDGKQSSAVVGESVGDVDYVLNTNTKKFHYPDCASVKQMSEKNKLEFVGTRDKVVDMGYQPCGNCSP